MKKISKLPFSIATYREDYLGKSFKDLKAALQKNKAHGNFICILGSGENRQLVFSNLKAYLYADHINLYKKLPRKFIYIEAVEAGYLLISILNGKVFFESNIITADDLFKQIEVFLNLNSEPLALSIFAPQQQKIFSDKFAGVSQINLQFLAKPLSEIITPNKIYLTFDPLLKNRLKLYQGMAIVLVIAAIGAGFVYNRYQQHKQRELLIEQQKKAAQHVDHYAAYKNEFQQNSASLILHNLNVDYQVMAPALEAGWSVEDINYNGSNLTFTLSSKNFDNLLEPLNSLATDQPGVNLQYDKSFNHGKVKITFPITKETKAIPTIIVPVKAQLMKFTDQMSLTFKSLATYNESSFSNHEVYTTAELSVSLTKISLLELTHFLANVDLYPAKIVGLTIKPADNTLVNPTFSLNSKIQFYGSN